MVIVLVLSVVVAVGFAYSHVAEILILDGIVSVSLVGFLVPVVCRILVGVVLIFLIVVVLVSVDVVLVYAVLVDFFVFLIVVVVVLVVVFVVVDSIVFYVVLFYRLIGCVPIVTASIPGCSRCAIWCRYCCCSYC